MAVSGSTTHTRYPGYNLPRPQVWWEKVIFRKGDNEISHAGVTPKCYCGKEPIRLLSWQKQDASIDEVVILLCPYGFLKKFKKNIS